MFIAITTNHHFSSEERKNIEHCHSTYSRSPNWFCWLLRFMAINIPLLTECQKTITRKYPIAFQRTYLRRETLEHHFPRDARKYLGKYRECNLFRVTAPYPTR